MSALFVRLSASDWAEGGWDITEPEQAERIIIDGQADAIFLARAMLRNPRWALNAAEKLDVKIAWPLSLDRARTLS